MIYSNLKKRITQKYPKNIYGLFNVDLPLELTLKYWSNKIKDTWVTKSTIHNLFGESSYHQIKEREILEDIDNAKSVGFYNELQFVSEIMDKELKEFIVQKPIQVFKIKKDILELFLIIFTESNENAKMILNKRKEIFKSFFSYIVFKYLSNKYRNSQNPYISSFSSFQQTDNFIDHDKLLNLYDDSTYFI